MSYTELINELKEDGFEIITDNTISKDNTCSFFYDGVVLEFKKGKYIYYIEANGEIEIRDKSGEVVFHNRKNYDDLINAKTDNDLIKIEEPEYTWEHNNWFELLVFDTENNDYVDDMGEIFGSLEDFLDTEYLNEIVEKYEKEE